MLRSWIKNSYAHLSSSAYPAERRNLFQFFLLVSGSIYLGWYFVVKLVAPLAQNPWPGRAAVVAIFYLFFAITLVSRRVRHFSEYLVYTGAFILTAHFFYLLHLNQMDRDWEVGLYITILTIAAVFFSRAACLAYSLFVLILCVGMSYYHQHLQSFFIPGVVTILLVANISLWFRAKALTDLAESLNSFEGLLNATFEGILVHEKGIMIEMNHAFADIFGYTRAELIGKHVDMLLTEAGRQQAHAMIQARLESPYLTLAMRKNGSSLYIEVAGKKHSYKGRAARLAAVQDVSARLVAEAERSRLIRVESAKEAAEFAERRSAFLAQTSHILSTSFDISANLQHFAIEAVKKLGVAAIVLRHDEQEPNSTEIILAHRDPSKEDWLRRFATELVGETCLGSSLKQALTEQRAQLVAKPRIQETNEFFQRLNFDSYIVIPITSRQQSLGTLLLFSSGPNLNHGDFELGREITDRMALSIENAKLYQSAQQAIRLRDEFISVASHELKTPLTPLRLQTEVLIRMLGQGDLSLLPKAKLNQMLSISQNQITRLANLVEELLDVSRIHAGRLSLHFESFDLLELVEEMAQIFSIQIEKAKSSLAIQSSGRLRVKWDRLRTEQVITNLLRNALIYGGAKPITIDLRQSEETIFISIQDLGIGISPEDQQRIFGRFERAVSHKNYGGLGLGLYIVRQIVEAHNGTINVESTLGEGARFKLEIPVDPLPTSN